MKKLLKFLIIILVLITLLCCAYREPLQDLLDSRELTAEEMLRRTFLTMDDSVCMLGYNLSEAELKALWNDVTSNHGDLFHLHNRYEYTTNNGKVLTLTPQYTMSAPEYEAALETYKSELMEILLTVNPSWSDVQTALYLHDYIAMHYAYDESTILNNAYEMVTQGKAVCQGYTLLYSDLMNACGIPCTTIVSESMRHTWNVVTIGGKQYHVDVTHDDPISDRLGKVEHGNFLRSDYALPEHRFTAAEGYGICTDTTYDDDAVWEGISSAFVPLGDAFYFIADGDLYKWQSGDRYYIDTIYATWYTDKTQTRYWNGHYSTLWAAGDVLLYSKPDRVLAYNPETGVYSMVYRHEGPGDIYGMQYIDGVLRIQVGSSPNLPGEIITVTNFNIPA